MCSAQNSPRAASVYLWYSAMGSSLDNDCAHAANIVSDPSYHGCRRMASENQHSRRIVLKTTASFMAEF